MEKSRKIIFLDRDGVINKKMPEGDYVKNWGEFEFLNGAVEALTAAFKKGYEIYIITNQAGVGKGLMKKEDLDLIHQNMQNELLNRGVRLGGIYCCCHTSKNNCKCRKPKPGMLFRAAKEHKINLADVFFIGDSQSDMEAANAAGCKAILLTKDINFFKICSNLI